jgi:F0F1-type ATP synthase delta subunit
MYPKNLFQRPVARLRLSVMAIVLFTTPPLAAQQQSGKIQQLIDSIKEIYDDPENDYHTDGRHIVWVKSYKKWTASDLVVMKKEDPQTLNFLKQAIQRNRLDVLEQLLPEYYRARGGVKQFAEDISNTH